jgi:hypothetical protein
MLNMALIIILRKLIQEIIKLCQILISQRVLIQIMDIKLKISLIKCLYNKKFLKAQVFMTIKILIRKEMEYSKQVLML